MKNELSQSLIDELNLIKIEYDENRGYCFSEYGFSDLTPDSGHLLWIYDNGSFGMANNIYMNHSDTHYWWGYGGSIDFQTESEVRNHLYHLRATIKKKIQEGKEYIRQRKLIKMEMDFV